MDKQDKIRWAILTVLIAAIFSTLGAVLSNRVMLRDTALQEAAPIEYVDKCNHDLKGYVDTQDGAIRREMIEIKRDINDDMDRIDTKLDNIYNILINQKP